jgi:hypothetical protein
MSRKAYRKKRRSCALCKPSKRGLAIRWSPREFSQLRSFERTLHRGGDWSES